MREFVAAELKTVFDRMTAGPSVLGAIFIERRSRQFTSHKVSRSSTLTVSRYNKEFHDVQNYPQITQ